MKNLLYILILILFPVLVLAQDQNWVKSTTYKQPIHGSISDPSIEQANVQVSYFDGLGRPIQQIAHKQSNTGKDIVTHIEYDAFGRQTKEFLPYVATGASLNYLPSAQTDLLSFYASPSLATTGNPAFEATGNPFSEKQLENSPLNRVFKQAAPGNPWIMGSGKEIKFDYQTNTATEVKLFKATATWNAGLGIYDISISQSGDYQANQLYKTITKDENWKPFDVKNNTTEEFKNKSGQVVLKRTYNNNEAYDTYYIYDQYGNLTYVIPPLAEGVASQTILDNLGYQYKYDQRNRLVAKKLPGKQWEFIVYDKLDRPIATGPAFSPYGDGSNGWMITEYDVFGRVTQTGWKAMTVSETNRNSNQTAVNSGSNPFVLGTNDILTKNFYDNYSFAGAPSQLPSPIENQAVATNVKGLPTGSWTKVLDDATSSNAELSYTVYDYKYRPVHTKTTNYLGGYTQVDTHLDWAGKTLYTLTKHKRTDADNELVIKDMFTYSPQDKLVVHKQQINSLPEQLITKNSYDELGQLISKNVGGTDITGATGLQTVDYTYNIRGWLKAINDVSNIYRDLFAFKINYNDAETATDLYNGNISETFWKTSSDNKLRKYDYTYDHLNRLLQADYSKEGSTTFNSYLEHLTYDKNGNIKTLVRNGDMDTDGMQFEQIIDELSYTYHPQNKNQLMKVIDSTNNLKGFKDDSDGITDTTDDYAYDLNGNMKSDTNKGITNIIYNHLNLPVEIVFPNGKINYLYNAIGQKVKKTVTEGTTITTTDYLSGFQYKNAVLQFFPHAEGYVNATQSGTSYVFNYVYNFTDHLGNIRLSYTKDPLTNVLKIIEENHYYPFGLVHSGYNSDKMMYSKEGSTVKIKPLPPLFKSSFDKKYNGYELEEDLGKNTYAYGWRDYDPSIGRFNKMDRFSEKYNVLTNYGYAGNNPVLLNDIQGDSIGIGKNLFNQFRDGVISKRNTILNNRNSRIEGLLSKGKTEKANKLISKFAQEDSQNNSDMAIINATLQELLILENSSQVYNLFENSSLVPSDADGVMVYNLDSGSVDIASKGKFSMGVFAHELKHAFQFQSGYHSFAANGKFGGMLYDMIDEYEAFDRGSFYGGLYLTRGEINNIYGDRGLKIENRNFSTFSGSNYNGTVNYGAQLIRQTFVSVVRGTAQRDFYIGSKNVERTIKAFIAIML